MSVISQGFGLGIALGPLVAGLLVNYCFTLPVLVIGTATLASAILVYKHMPETVQKKTNVLTRK